MKSIRLLLLGLAVALSLTGCAAKAEKPSHTPEPVPTSTPVETLSPPSLALPLPTPSPTPSPEPEEGNYFDNALFVGDSIMEGIRQYVAAQRQEGEMLGTARFLTTTMGVSLADLVGDRDGGVQFNYQREEALAGYCGGNRAPAGVSSAGTERSGLRHRPGDCGCCGSLYPLDRHPSNGLPRN